VHLGMVRATLHRQIHRCSFASVAATRRENNLRNELIDLRARADRQVVEDFVRQLPVARPVPDRIVAGHEDDAAQLQNHDSVVLGREHAIFGPKSAGSCADAGFWAIFAFIPKYARPHRQIMPYIGLMSGSSRRFARPLVAARRQRLKGFREAAMASTLLRDASGGWAAKEAVLITGRYGLAAILIGAALGATLTIRYATGNPTFFAFYAAIFVSIWFAGRGPGLMALLLSSAMLLALFRSTSDWASVMRVVPTLLAFVASAVIAELLSDQRHRAEGALRAAGEQLELAVQERTEQLQQTNEELLREVAERKRAEANLQTTQERWRRVYEASAAGMALSRLDGRFLAANPAFQRMLGYTEEEIKGHTSLELTHPDERPANVDVLAEFKSGQRQEYHVEKRYLRKDGSPVWVNVTTALVARTV
jgi:PAS domain S-box-containing protein